LQFKNNFIVIFIIVFGTLSFPVFQQKSAVVFLAPRETPSFTGSGLRSPPNSPGFNPVDYKLCGIMHLRVYRTPTRDVDDVKQRLADTWSGMQQSAIDKTTSDANGSRHA